MTDTPTVPATPRPAAGRGFPRAFGLAALLVYAVEFAIARSPLAATRPMIPLAITLDLTLFVPALYWLLVIRPAGASARRVVAVFVLSFLGARFVLLPGQREYLLYVRFLGAPVELALIAYIVIKVRRAARGYQAALAGTDVPERIAAALADAIPYRGLARVLATEFAVLHYALMSWRRAPHVPPDTDAFTWHRKSGRIALMVAVTGAAVVELFVMHLVVHAFSARLAWGLSGLSAFGIVWLVGFTRAIVLRPVLVTAHGVTVRGGLQWWAELPFAAIERVETGRLKAPASGLATAADELRIGGAGRASARLYLREPAEVLGVYGRRKRVRTISLTLDEPAAFAQAVGRRRGTAT